MTNPAPADTDHPTRHEAARRETIELRDAEEERVLLGSEDRNLRILREALGLRIIARGGRVLLEGDERTLRRGARVVRRLVKRVRDHGELPDHVVQSLLTGGAAGRRAEEERRATRARSGGNGGGRAADAPVGEGGAATDRIVRALDDSPISPKTPGQTTYVNAVHENDIVFAIGPAGTGKTYLAVAMAIGLMKRGVFRKLVLARPAVEAGERLGFLPGDLTAKVSPYLRPLYDAIGDILPFAEVQTYMERDIVEVVPLAYMRGRTLDHAFIILDEAQNTTPRQMKMFLTRMGRRSKIVVTGDITQSDLPRGVRSGLRDAHQKLSGIDGIAFCKLGRGDIVRHPLVQRIVDAYGEETLPDGDGSPDDPSRGHSPHRG